MLKNLLLALFTATAAAVSAAAYELPPIRDIGSVKILILPNKLHEEVVLNFDKLDFNGYTGTDVAVATVVSPGGKSVWEATLPDDGDSGSGWKPGPRQPVECRFTPTETGIYTMSFNTASFDFALCFDRTRGRNVRWGLQSFRFRFCTGALNAYILLEPRTLGESQKLPFQIRTIKRSRITGMNLRSGDTKYIDNFDLPPHTNKMDLQYHAFDVVRGDTDDLYQLTATRFDEVVSSQFPSYSNPVLFPEADFAAAFRGKLSADTPRQIVKFAAPGQIEPLAFMRNQSYQVRFMAEKAAPFDFTVELFGTKHRLSDRTPSFSFTVPQGKTYSAIDLSAAPAGTLTIAEQAVTTPTALLPESGSLLTTAPLAWLPVAGCAEYLVRLTAADHNKTLTFTTRDAWLPGSEFIPKLTPGVWSWQVADAQTRNFGAPAFFILPQAADTTLPLICGFTPPMDTTLQETPRQITIDLLHKTAADIDLARSFFTLNGKKFAPFVAAPNRLGFTPDPLRKGHNLVTAGIVDRTGNLTATEWNLTFQNTPPRQIAIDTRGNLKINGADFYPVIYYGYGNPAMLAGLRRQGFNVRLSNTLSSSASLDVMRNNNLKVLDSGSVYYGIYSKNSTPEKDVAAMAASGALAHDARLGAWMDEMDVHKSQAEIDSFLALYGSSANGLKGVCSCNRGLYKAMADAGDYLMIDYYASGKSLFALNDAFTAARQAAGTKPVLALLMGYSVSDPKLTGFVPSENDLRYAAYAAIRHGLNGFGLYQCGEFRLESYPDAWAQAVKLYREIAALNFVALGENAPNAVQITGLSAPVDYRSIKVGNRLYVIAQNSGFTPTIAEIRFSPRVADRLQVLFENRVIDGRAGKFVDAFAPAATHVYSVTLP